MKDKFSKYFFNTTLLLCIYILITLLISVLQYIAGNKEFNGYQYTHYNNYVIFKQSFFHLLNNQPLYVEWPQEHWDFYKYSPTFPLLFAPFALLPDLIGLSVWNLLNALCLFFAVKNLSAFDEKKKQLVLWFILPELVISLQNSQSNGLMAALLIAAFNCAESKKLFVAAILICISAYIKIFGLVAFAMYLFYPERWRGFIYGAITMVVFALLPLLITSFGQLKLQYSGWLFLLKADQDASVGLSVLGWLKTWFGYDAPKNIVTLIGVVLFCLPLLKFKNYGNLHFRLLTLSSVLIWVIIFNHRAESPTFIIAICGAAIWYFTNSTGVSNHQFKNLDLVLLISAFVFASLSPTDIFPKIIRTTYVVPYVLKAVPFIFIWMKILFEQITFKDLQSNSD